MSEWELCVQGVLNHTALTPRNALHEQGIIFGLVDVPKFTEEIEQILLPPFHWFHVGLLTWGLVRLPPPTKIFFRVDVRHFVLEWRGGCGQLAGETGTGFWVSGVVSWPWSWFLGPFLPLGGHRATWTIFDSPCAATNNPALLGLVWFKNG